MLHYFLTGSERSRAAVVELAQWVLDMDDGTKSRFWWVDNGETGLASATFASDYSPGRGAGNSVNALLDAHRLTDDPRYLAKADQIVARCAHPSDDPDRLNLRDAETRWSYTVFLQTLGKYLEYRGEKGLIDSWYHYARAVLLRYADWMAEDEEPYLDHPERLEFPTETWAAQDMRKAAVFEYAARHEPTEAGCQRFRRRADDFLNYAIFKLQTMPTRSLTRPIVLLLAYGFQRPQGPQGPMTGNVEVALPTQPNFGAAKRFVPYKRRVFFKIALLAGSMLTAGAMTLTWFMWLRG